MIKFNLKDTTKYLAIALLLISITPTAAFAKKDSSSDFGYDGGWSDTGYSDYGSDYYAPSYGYDTGYGYNGGWSDTGYSDYGSDYYAPSYGTDTGYGGYSGGYTPSYGGTSYGNGGLSYNDSTVGGYYTPSYSSGSTPSNSYSYSSSNPYTTSNANASNSNKINNVATGGNAVASSSNINNNINNVYVYTNPSGNAVVHNPEYQRLDGYCTITPSNPRTGQTVTATAYITGGIGSYTYVWGGDLTSQATGVSTSFTSYTTGTKNISVTARSGQDVVTKNCTVTFDNGTQYTNGYVSSSVTTGTAVSGVFLQPNQIRTGTPVSGVYLNDLPATGMDLGFMDYMIGFMVLGLATIMVLVSRAKKSFVSSTLK